MIDTINREMRDNDTVGQLIEKVASQAKIIARLEIALAQHQHDDDIRGPLSAGVNKATKLYAHHIMPKRKRSRSKKWSNKDRKM